MYIKRLLDQDLYSNCDFSNYLTLKTTYNLM